MWRTVIGFGRRRCRKRFANALDCPEFLRPVAVPPPILPRDMIGSQSDALPADGKEESRGPRNAYNQRGIAASLALAGCFHH
jgi:hypothetical protein